MPYCLAKRLSLILTKSTPNESVSSSICSSSAKTLSQVMQLLASKINQHKIPINEKYSSIKFRVVFFLPIEFVEIPLNDTSIFCQSYFRSCIWSFASVKAITICLFQQQHQHCRHGFVGQPWKHRRLLISNWVSNGPTARASCSLILIISYAKSNCLSAMQKVVQGHSDIAVRNRLNSRFSWKNVVYWHILDPGSNFLRRARIDEKVFIAMIWERK